MSEKLLSEVNLFESLPREVIDVISRRCTWRNYSVGEQVVAYKDPDRHVYFIIDGQVRVKLYSLEGKEVSYRDIGAGGFFGEFAAIDGEMRSADVVALSDARIASMSPDVFWDIIKDHPSVTAELLRHFTKMIRMYSRRIFEFSTLAVNNRLHAELLRLARSHLVGNGTAIISPSPTHAEIASRISTHREAVTREMNNLKRVGLVTRTGKALHILDVKRLEQLVEQVIG